MRIGYACVNTAVGVTTSRTFRVSSYTPERFHEITGSNLDALETILRWNVAHGITYFRISSGLVPLASHPVVTDDWRRIWRDRFAELGAIIREAGMRVTMHPGQYTVLNSPREDVVVASIAELQYHADVLDLLGTPDDAKIQLHTGGVYGDREAAIARFVATWPLLPERVRARLAIENDERSFPLADNLRIHQHIGVPLVFDTFHHSLLNHGESLEDALTATAETWRGHGPMMLDYSTQDPTKRRGAHIDHIDLADFAAVWPTISRHHADVMLEIKDKQASVLAAHAYLQRQASEIVDVAPRRDMT